MIDGYDIAAVRAAEQAAMAELPEGELMRRAAEGLAQVAAARLDSHGGRSVVALVGGGDNGGDTLYAAARLASSGADVAAVLLSERVHGPGLEAARAAGVGTVDAVDPAGLPAAREALAGADLVLDGIVGIGGRPGLAPHLRAVVAAVPDAAYVIAVDLPSGADPHGLSQGDSGDGSDAMVFADETVTFGEAKPVHLLPPSEAAVGRLTVIDIGITLTATPAVQRLTHDDAGSLWPVPGPADDKYSRGVLGVVAGGESYTGAALLSVTAAVEAGAGMVRYVGPSTPTGLIRALVPEAVFGAGRVQAWLVGPGLDTDDESGWAQAQRAAGRDALGSGQPCVVDAGGLDLLDPGALPRRSPTLLTPHDGELARLLGRLTGDTVERSRVAAAPARHAGELAELTGATVLLKGSTTLVVPPPGSGRPIRSQADAPAWLGTAGSGDVLAGLAGALLAAGLDPLDAGSLAALVHGLSGEAANPGGPVRALGVAHGIPRVVAGLLTRSARRS